jgi:uncharacterized membrane protein
VLRSQYVGFKVGLDSNVIFTYVDIKSSDSIAAEHIIFTFTSYLIFAILFLLIITSTLILFTFILTKNRNCNLYLIMNV